MDPDTLTPELRRNLRAAFDQLADLLDEETERLPRADTEELALYAEAKRRLFEQLAILLREANDPARSLHLVDPAAPAEGTAPALPPPQTPPGPTTPAFVGSGAAGAEGEAGEAGAEPGEGDADMPDPAAPELLRAAARRLRDRVEINRRGLLAAQDAVAAVARHVGRAVEQQQTDGVYARAGSLRPRSQPGFGRVEHEL